jgi:hypothetical protein
MPSLLNLPRELRDHIIELVLITELSPPAGPSSAASQNRTAIQDVKQAAWDYGPTHVMYEAQPDYVTTSLPLLLVNRQLSAETKAALQRLPLTYGLDVMFVNEQELLPTWLCVPALSDRVDHVVATFRAFNTADAKGRSGFMGGDGGPPEILWCFYSLLERFLKCGPVGDQGKPDSPDRNITIQVLTLDFVTPPDINTLDTTPEKLDYWRYTRRRRERIRSSANGLPMSVVRPEWLAEFIMRDIYGLLAMGYHTAAYGGILYERIGVIRICVDGNLKAEMELGEILPTMRREDPSHTFGHIYPHELRLPAFYEWKKRALEKRREAGLPVIEPSSTD